MQTQSNNRNTMLVGKKPVMNYVLACLIAFQDGSEEVTLKARGRAICRAVDAALITTQRYAPEITVKGVTIDTEGVKDPVSGVVDSVSTIEIRLSR